MLVLVHHCNSMTLPAWHQQCAMQPLLKLSRFITAVDYLVTDFWTLCIRWSWLLFHPMFIPHFMKCVRGRKSQSTQFFPNYCPRLFGWFLVGLEYGSWAHLAPQCCTLAVPLQLSSELCRKIFQHVLAELCRFAASYFHSAGRHQDCPPAEIKIRHRCTVRSWWWADVPAGQI